MNSSQTGQRWRVRIQHWGMNFAWREGIEEGKWSVSIGCWWICNVRRRECFWVILPPLPRSTHLCIQLFLAYLLYFLPQINTWTHRKPPPKFYQKYLQLLHLNSTQQYSYSSDIYHWTNSTLSWKFFYCFPTTGMVSPERGHWAQSNAGGFWEEEGSCWPQPSHVFFALSVHLQHNFSIGTARASSSTSSMSSAINGAQSTYFVLGVHQLFSQFAMNLQQKGLISRSNTDIQEELQALRWEFHQKMNCLWLMFGACFLAYDY